MQMSKYVEFPSARCGIVSRVHSFSISSGCKTGRSRRCWTRCLPPSCPLCTWCGRKRLKHSNANQTSHLTPTTNQIKWKEFYCKFGCRFRVRLERWVQLHRKRIHGAAMCRPIRPEWSADRYIWVRMHPPPCRWWSWSAKIPVRSSPMGKEWSRWCSSPVIHFRFFKIQLRKIWLIYGGSFEAHVVVLISQLAHTGRRFLFEVERFDLTGVTREVLQTVDRRLFGAGTRQTGHFQLPVLVGRVAQEETQCDVVLFRTERDVHWRAMKMLFYSIKSSLNWNELLCWST